MKTEPELPDETGPEPGRENLRRALAALSAHEPDGDAWARIAGQLAAEQAIQAALPQLPTHEPDASAWQAIAARLDAATGVAAEPMAAAEPAAAIAPPAPITRTLWPAQMRWAAGLAAAVLLVLGVWGLWPAPSATAPTLAAAPRETMSYGEEVAVLPPAPAGLALPADPLAQEGEAFIDAHCTSLPTVCESGEFQDLRAQLADVAAQQQRLAQDAQRFGSSPALVREQGQLTVLHATLTRELVQLLIS
ncbi:hypothetical protein [Hymenobacter actinosclerus]|uniref:Uncharacterized protein n=1 Tax=Hymenobacter actinosclerus TaxID=82805 RepID=A0A1I0F2T7_9BACT|nr:hypothetical protein [Hymenobacter actinosclerus]SET52343.1 hypothetical protein SAMN04487998_2102 [Hymenobacter actinosclerus]